MIGWIALHRKGHEEEFLRFVYMKYDVKPELRGRPNNSGASSARNASSNAQSAAGEVSNDDQGSVNGLRQHEQEHGHESNGEEGERRKGLIIAFCSYFLPFLRRIGPQSRGPRPR